MTVSTVLGLKCYVLIFLLKFYVNLHVWHIRAFGGLFFFSSFSFNVAPYLASIFPAFSKVESCWLLQKAFIRLYPVKRQCRLFYNSIASQNVIHNKSCMVRHVGSNYVFTWLNLMSLISRDPLICHLIVSSFHWASVISE